MSSHLSVFALSAILIASMGISPIFGQIVEPIVVTTDKASYDSGETIVISGQVRDLLFGTPVTLQMFEPANGNRVLLAQLETDADRTYGVDITAGGPLWKYPGTYTIKVQYGTTDSRTAEATFEFGGPGTGPIDTETTQLVEGTDFALRYTITGGSISSITIDEEAKSLRIAIDSTDDGELTITLPRELIDSMDMGGEDTNFIVLVDLAEEEFDETTTEADRTLTIPFQNGAEEIEIIGTFVIPEFGTVAVLVLAVAIISIVAVTTRSRLGIMPKY